MSSFSSTALYEFTRMNFLRNSYLHKKRLILQDNQRNADRNLGHVVVSPLSLLLLQFDGDSPNSSLLYSLHEMSDEALTNKHQHSFYIN